ncbi:MAG TPA: glycosyltransferase family 9 protein [bacterium]|nr:glycosyltransferase family 9 protein [bacterium]
MSNFYFHNQSRLSLVHFDDYAYNKALISRGLYVLATVRSILIVKLGAVGDCIHALVPLRALRLAFPQARIGWLVEGKSKEVVIGHEDLDLVHIWDRKQSSRDFLAGHPLRAWSEIRRVINEMRAAEYEVAIDFQNLFKSGFFAWQSGAATRIGFSRLREGNFLFTNRRVPAGNAVGHMVQRYLKLLEPLGISSENTPLAKPIFIPNEKKTIVDEYWRKYIGTANVVALNPAASQSYKLWPPERYAAVADRLAREYGMQPIIIWGPGEERLAHTILDLMQTSGLPAPPTTIKELAYLLSRCAMYVGNDTGPMHLAAAMGIAVVGLFGPTEERRVGPWSVRARAVTPPEPFSKKRRMDAITVEQVVHAVSELLEG